MFALQLIIAHYHITNMFPSITIIIITIIIIEYHVEGSEHDQTLGRPVVGGQYTQRAASPNLCYSSERERSRFVIQL